jgi:hypothetical protein
LAERRAGRRRRGIDIADPHPPSTKPYRDHVRFRLICRLSIIQERAQPMSYVYVVQMDIPQHLEAEFNRIYDEDHVPTILKVPGVRSCARYRLEHSTVPSMPRYLAIYETDSAEVINSPAWQEASDLGEWKPKIRPHTTNRQHSVFRRIA